MARYRYAGPGPHEVVSLDDGTRELTRPGDVREFDAEPGWGPWELLEEPAEPVAPPAGRQSGEGLAPAPAGADGGQSSVSPTPPPVLSALAKPAAGTEGK